MIRMALAAVCALLFSITTMTPFVQASEITISGSTSVARIMDVLAEKYNQQHPRLMSQFKVWVLPLGFLF